MRRSFAGTLLLLFAAGCAPGGDEPPTREEALLPGGYRVELDAGRSDPGQFDIRQEQEFLRFTTGPAGVAWRPQDVVESGDFLAEATFTVFNAPPGYREAFGVFVGGRSLDTASATYTYLLARPTGDFMVKRRMGDSTAVVVDWTSHAAVQRVAGDGDQPSNILGILVMGDEASFLVNGTVVYRMPAGDIEPYGIAGIRVNHRLDLRIASWYLGAPPLQTGQ